MFRRPLGLAAVLLLFALGLGLSACNILAPRKPAIVILSPMPGSLFQPGETVTIQSTATDANGIVRVELGVDGSVVRADAPPSPQTSYPVSQTWQATPGQHTLSVRAFNEGGVPSDPALIQINVAGGPAAAPTLGPTTQAALATPSAPTNCTDDATFVADVTIPDGTVMAPRQSFEKVWRVRNSGSCPWGSGYQFVLLNGQVMAATPITVPDTGPGATADLRVSMTAPTTSGNFNSLWRLRNPAGTLFGETLNVTIRVVGGATPSNCSGTPNIEFFTANLQTITAGQSATLNWGLVSNADSATIDNGLGGVPTPGSAAVKPAVTTTYTLTASCGTITRTAQVTITVNPVATAAPLPPTVPPATATAPPSPTSRPSPAPGSIVRCFAPGESGEAIKSGTTRAASPLPQTGDDSANNAHRAVLSFDIRDLGGKTIDSATLNISAVATQGNPMSLGPLLVQEISFTPPVTGVVYDLGGATIATIASGPVGQYDVKAALQNAVSGNRTRLQLRLQLATETNGNNAGDLLTFDHNTDICLNIAYR